MATLAVILCVNFVACSNDDDDNNTSALAKTTWLVTEGNFFFEPGHIITFKANGNFITNDKGWEKHTGNVYHLLDGNWLVIDFHGDDHIYGHITIDGDNAIYTCTGYTWGGYDPRYDYSKDWAELDERDKRTLILQKQKYNESPTWFERDEYYDYYD